MVKLNNNFNLIDKMVNYYLNSGLIILLMQPNCQKSCLIIEMENHNMSKVKVGNKTKNHYLEI